MDARSTTLLVLCLNVTGQGMGSFSCDPRKVWRSFQHSNVKKLVGIVMCQVTG